MEHAEIVSITTEYVLGAMEASTLYLSVLTGYLVVAYAVGKDLSKFQLFLITSLFIAFSGFFGSGSYSFFMIGHGLQIQWGADTYSGAYMSFALWIGSVQALGIIGSLYFMYEARKK